MSLQDLGFVTQEPTVKDGKVQITYKTHTKCVGQSNKNISSVIQFVCSDTKVSTMTLRVR